MFLSRPINRYVENCSQKSLQYTIGVFVFINVYLGWIQGVDYAKDGYNLINFIMLYLIGRYLRLYWKNDYKAGRDIAVFVLSSAGTVCLALALNYLGCDVYMALSYNSPFVILSAVSMLLLFTKLHFTNKVVNYLASSSLAIYLFQEGGYNFYKKIKAMYVTEWHTVSFILMIIVLFALSMLIPMFIDKLRLLAFGSIEAKVSELLDKNVFRKLEI